ncbi:dTDP-4-amino-4,6-dideoxygalactose transaminase [Pseudomonas poae]|uniref:dTDP-4-amino-4,6-dideoxygalactose transaminase n=1 Tax=Pseudomonas poae TaxID=200451 RepID=A0A423FK17_9PSED|nr:dTDP-4-amino-4,6-dideoxygalactose transaminase [Pseudomonas poae]ROM58304.1 dTDP-4-amino-4,6-dideoxygalactose transaminase [Pseudomonas poae]
MKIPFNKPPYTGNEDQYVTQAMRSAKMSGDGDFTVSCQRWFEETFSCVKALLTPSCTQALEMAAILIDIQPGDEVIMPSFTFVSTANAFVLRGAKIVFVDIRPDTMNIDETLIEAAITDNTKAIVPVHYAGVACEMDVIMDIAQRHGLFVVEDAAQGMMSTYKGRKLGTIGHLAAYSFHETKNYTSGGEGGLLLINDERFIGRAEIIREKGTNRSQFFRGMIDKYTWVDIGSSYLPGELQAAYLFGQLERADVINDFRLSVWQRYNTSLAGLVADGLIETPTTPNDCVGNAHMFYIKVKDIKARTACIKHLNAVGVGAVFHYVPLHSAPAGVVLGRFAGEDRFTTQESERLIRLPIWYGMTDSEVQYVIDSVIGAVDAAGR